MNLSFVELSCLACILNAFFMYLVSFQSSASFCHTCLSVILFILFWPHVSKVLLLQVYCLLTLLLSLKSYQIPSHL